MKAKPGKGKGRLRKSYLSVSEVEYLNPDRVNHCRLQARKLGKMFKSGKRVVKFDGVRVPLTVITIRDKIGVGAKQQV